MNTRRVKLDCHDALKDIERKFYKAESYQSILMLAIEQGKENVDVFEDRYIAAVKDLEECKADFEKNFLLSHETEGSISWELDFVNEEVIFTEK